MTMIDWRLTGAELANCNCAWGCPCQFNALPTHGHCRASVMIHVDSGHFGTTRFDGLNFGGLFAWPGPIHEGHGEALPIIDERATPAQRQAILKIMAGEESEPGSNMFTIFASTLEKMHEPQFRPIEFDLDVDGAKGRFHVKDLVEAKAEPIRNVVTGQVQRVQVSMPNGFEFLEAEFASGEVRTFTSPIALQWEGTHAHLCRLDMTGAGLVRA